MTVSSVGVSASASPSSELADLAARYRAIREQTERLAAPLSAEDQVVQSMPDVSPTKWHRAHTTWFSRSSCCRRRSPTTCASIRPTGTCSTATTRPSGPASRARVEE